MNRTLAIALKVFLPLVVLALGVLVTWYLLRTPPRVEERAPQRPLRLVRVQVVETRDLELTVRTQGTVRPRTESTLVPQVSGTVVRVSESWAEGGFFKAGEALLVIEPADYELALAGAEAQVAQARLRLENALQEAEVARREWESLGLTDTQPSPLVLRLPQLAEARAALGAAEAVKKQALLDLERTSVRAPPFDGRVREVQVDLGQYVTRGSPVGRVYSVDRAEVRLPVPDEDLAFVDLPIDFPARGLAASADDGARAAGPEVILRATFAGKEHSWRGRIVRTEGEIDPRSRMVHAVAQVENPYGYVDSGRPPLAVGLFVEAEIRGRRHEDVVVLPRAALRRGPGESERDSSQPRHVLVVDAENRLRFREVEVLRVQADEAIVSGGLEPGERVCISALDVVVEGMRVRPAAENSDERRGVR